jgi:hypothetical protein
MASNLYSRYIPPKNTKMVLQDASAGALAPSEATPTPIQNAPLEPISFRQHSPQQDSIQPTPSSSSKPLKRKHKDGDPLLGDQQPRPKRSKGHKSVLLKRDKSAKKSEKLVNSFFWTSASSCFLLIFTNLQCLAPFHPLPLLPHILPSDSILFLPSRPESSTSRLVMQYTITNEYI